jgi:hypothetical protein
MDDEEGEMGPMLIDRLQEHGVNAKDIERLKERGFHTVESVAYATMKSLGNVKGISDVKAEKLQAEASKLVPMGFLTVSCGWVGARVGRGACVRCACAGWSKKVCVCMVRLRAAGGAPSSS